jgi:hypothetical protein
MIGNKKKGKETHAPRKTFNTSAAPGRKRGSRLQQRCINTHNSSVKVGWDGLGGRLPSITATTTAAAGRLLNGTAPVNTYFEV